MTAAERRGPEREGSQGGVSLTLTLVVVGGNVGGQGL